MNHLFTRKAIIVIAAMGLINFSAHAQSWSLTGNSGTNSSTNFIGTKDNLALVFRTNNSERMRIQGTGNIGININSPVQRLDVNGNINIRTGFGLYVENHRILKVDSVGGNTFLGNGVAPQNTGLSNTGIGYNTLLFNTSGNGNTATGDYSLYLNSTGFDNTANGTYALYDNTSGSFNTANGYMALYDNTVGYYNTANGTSAMALNGSGSYNTANGSFALYFSGDGYGNTASGDHALFYNWGSYNTATGAYALFSNTLGQYNTAVGVDALYNNTTSYYNCALGYLALAYSIEPGWNNTAIGSFAGPADGLYNTITLGEGAYASASNQGRIGNSSTTSIGGYANWTNISDGRVKKNIRENVPGLAFINKLKPVTYNLDLDAADKLIQRPARKDINGKIIELSSQEVNDRNAKQQIVYTGFVAQDVEGAAKELNYDFSGVDAPKNDKDLYGLRYAEFVVPLVKAVQELSKSSDEKDTKIDALKKQGDDQDKRIEQLEAMMSVKTQETDHAQQTTGLSDASLEQNIPNPFSNSTTVPYTLPGKYSHAQIVITDESGQTVKQIDLSGNGKGMITIDVPALSSGTYQYSLFVDGQKVSTRQMVLNK